MRVRFVKVLAVLVLSLSSRVVAEEPAPARTLLAISKTDHVLAILDPADLKVLGRVPVGPDPHEVVASADGTRAYVSNTGGGFLHQIDVIDLTARKALPSLDTGPLIGPHGLAYVGEKLWFTAQGAKSVGRFDPASGRVDWALGTGQDRTHMIHVAADGKRIYTTNVGSDTVSILDNLLLQPSVPPTGVLPANAQAHMDWVQTLVPVVKASEGFDVSPDGRQLWTASPEGTLSVVDTAAGKAVATIHAELPGAHRLAFTPDGLRVLAVSVRTGEGVFVEVATHRVIKRLKVGRGAAMLMDPVGDRAFVSCTPDNDAAVVDLRTMEVARRLDVGGRPDGMAWAVRPPSR